MVVLCLSCCPPLLRHVPLLARAQLHFLVAEVVL